MRGGSGGGGGAGGGAGTSAAATLCPPSSLTAPGSPPRLAGGETAILLHPFLPSVGVLIRIERGCQ